MDSAKKFMTPNNSKGFFETFLSFFSSKGKMLDSQSLQTTDNSINKLEINMQELNDSSMDGQLVIDEQKKCQKRISSDQDRNFDKINQKKKRYSVAYKRNLWNNPTYFPNIHKYKDIMEIFLTTQNEFLKYKFPNIYVLHFDLDFDTTFISDLIKEIQECGSFKCFNMQLDEDGYLKNDIVGITFSYKERIPLHFIDYEGVIDDICITNLKLLSFYTKVFNIIIINRNDLNLKQFCKFRKDIPSDTFLIYNGIKITNNDVHPKSKNVAHISSVSYNIKSWPTLYDLSGKLDDMEVFLQENFSHILNLLRNNQKLYETIDGNNKNRMSQDLLPHSFSNDYNKSNINNHFDDLE